MADIQRFGDEYRRASKDGFDASLRSFGEVNKGFQAIAATVMDYSKKSFEDGTHAMQQLVGAKSFEQAWEIQAQYAKKAFDAYVAQASKIGEMYVDLARSAYQPVEQSSAAVPPRESFSNLRPMTRCVSKPSLTASFVIRIQFLNIIPPRDGLPTLPEGATTVARGVCSRACMRPFVHCNSLC